MHPGQRVLACLSRTAVTSSPTTSFSSVRCIVRLVGKLCFFDNFRTHYGEFHSDCPKTFEHPSVLSDNYNCRLMSFMIHPCQGCSAVHRFLTLVSSQGLENVLIASARTAGMFLFVQIRGSRHDGYCKTTSARIFLLLTWG